MKRAVVCGAGGFIGSHLVTRLKADGYWVRGVDLKRPEFSPTPADEFKILDLRDAARCEEALRPSGSRGRFDEVYQLAADMGGMGFIHSAESDILRNNALIDINMTHAAAGAGVGRYFFSSSVCVYRDMAPGEPPLAEAQAYPAQPDNEYGWEKLYAERVAMVYGRRHNLATRIARFQNCYGPEGTWTGGREKAPAAICRKVAMAKLTNERRIEIWGDGQQTRSFTYIDDCLEGTLRLTASDVEEPLNIGSSELVTINELVDIVSEIAGVQLKREYVLDAPQGVRGRNSDNTLVRARLGWEPTTSLQDGLAETYAWVHDQVAAGLVRP